MTQLLLLYDYFISFKSPLDKKWQQQLKSKCGHCDYTVRIKERQTMQSISVGIREAKINLSKLLKSVQKGREIIITDRGKPVGKIIPVSAVSLPLTDRVHEMERQGWIEPRKKKTRELHPPILLPDELAQKYLEKDRKS